MWNIIYSRGHAEEETLEGFVKRIQAEILDGDYKSQPFITHAYFESNHGARSELTALGLDRLNAQIYRAWREYSDFVATEGGHFAECGTAIFRGAM